MLKNSALARIVNVSSDAHRRVEMNFGDLQFEEGYNGSQAYAQSKLANLLFTYELARRLNGSGVTVDALYPGFVNTHIYGRVGIFGPLIRFVAFLFGKSPRQGAATSIYLASSPKVEGISGAYFVDHEPVFSSPASYEEGAAKRLWAISQDVADLSRLGD